jgi:hypothetical protein
MCRWSCLPTALAPLNCKNVCRAAADMIFAQAWQATRGGSSSSVVHICYVTNVTEPNQQVHGVVPVA